MTSHGLLALLLSAAGAPLGAPSGALEVAWPSEGLPTGRATLVQVTSPASRPPMVSLTGTIGDVPLVVLPASADRRSWLVLAPVGIEQRRRHLPLALEATLQDGSAVSWKKPAPIVEAPYDERHLTVSKKFVKPTLAQRKRAAREAKALTAALSKKTPERLWRGSFARPTPGVETSPFGTKRTYNDKKKSRHLGLDLDGAVGAPITSTGRGRVVLAVERFYSGGTVVVDHGQSLFTMYFHMSRIDVRAGDAVEKGQGLGAVGATGQVTGPHLHFSVRFGDLYVDPARLLALDLSADAEDGSPASAVTRP
ncbi:MAG: M23 family metallopeptidase [Deltaproteobacteria bacterium]|nr:M23 family metallopeptidase [Deltaproteobacteria bacterium]